MTELLSNVEAIIIMFAPVALSYFTQFIDWFVTVKKFKSLDLERQLAPVLIKKINY